MSSFALVTNTHGQERVFEFTSPNVSIGRQQGSDFTLDHPTVSRQHAQVVWDGYYKLVVLSRGGLTAIDGQQVAGEVPLYDGSQLMFGQLAFTFRSQHAPARPPNPYGPGQQGAQNPVHGNGFQPASVDGMHQTNSGIYQSQDKLPSPDATVSFHQITSSGQFPSMAEHEKLARMRAAAENSDGLVSWEEIAAEAENAPEQEDALAHFQRMQREQEKADAENRGTNPMLIIAAILGVGMVMLLFVYGGDVVQRVGGGEATVDPVEQTAPHIAWRPQDADCIGVAQCKDAAADALKLGEMTYERKEADIINLYEAYKNLSLAEKYLEKGGMTDPPSGMAKLPKVRMQVGEEMQSHFMRLRANFFAEEDRNDYEKMAKILTRIQAYYPDERLNYHIWANRRINDMKSKNVYPRKHGKF